MAGKTICAFVDARVYLRIYMKRFLKRVVLWQLRVMAGRRLKKFRGKVVAVTGSVGKTSAKEAIYTVLNSKFRVRKSEKSMNTDFGLLLTILEIESGYSSVGKWSWLLLKAFFHSLFRDHSEVLLLEFGVDKPKDMDFLTSVIKPDIAVMTNVFPVHLAEGQFKNLQEIFDEKKKLVEALKEGGAAILNLDNPYTKHLAKTRGKKGTFTYGSDKDADFWFSNVRVSLEGTKFHLHHKDEIFNVVTPAIGKIQAYTAVPAIICGFLLGMSAEEAVLAMERYSLPPGRMSVIPAKVEGANLLDSSYNSSPEALKEALALLADLAKEKEHIRRVAVLGNMNELGEETEKLHRLVGEMIPSCVDLLITVGKEARFMAEAAIEKGMEEKSVHSFKTSKEAIDFFEDKLKKDDLVLVKGSQNNVRLERFVKALMAFPEDAKKLLARQEKFWEEKL